MKPGNYSVLLLLACACASAESFEASDLEAINVASAGVSTDAEGTSDVLHRFDVGTETIAFHWLGQDNPKGDDWSIAIEQNIRHVDYVAAMWREYGPVTSLEVFYA